MHQRISSLCLWLRRHFLLLLKAEISMIVQIIMFFDQQSWTALFWKLVWCGNYVIYMCVWLVLGRSCDLYLNKTIFRQKKFTLSPCPQVNNCKAEEMREKLWRRVTRMWPGRKEDDECILLQVRKWIRKRTCEQRRQEESFIKWVKWLLLSDLTTTDLLLAVADVMWSSNTSW